MCETVSRKLTDRNLHSPNVIVYPEDLYNFIVGKLKTFIVTDWRGNELERYYGVGLRRLMDSAKKFKDEPWCLAERFYKPKQSQRTCAPCCTCDEH